MDQSLKELIVLIQQFKTQYKLLDKDTRQAYQIQYKLYQDLLEFYSTHIPPSSLEVATKKIDLVIAKILETHQQTA